MAPEEETKFGVMLFDVDTLKFTVLFHQCDESTATQLRKDLIAQGKPAYIFKHNRYYGTTKGDAPHILDAKECEQCSEDARSVVAEMSYRAGNEKHRA